MPHCTAVVAGCYARESNPLPTCGVQSRSSQPSCGAGRWQPPNSEGGWVAVWRYKAMNIRSTRPEPKAALDALVRYLEGRETDAGTRALIKADLSALAAP